MEQEEQEEDRGHRDWDHDTTDLSERERQQERARARERDLSPSSTHRARVRHPSSTQELGYLSKETTFNAFRVPLPPHLPPPPLRAGWAGEGSVLVLYV